MKITTTLVALALLLSPVAASAQTADATAGAQSASNSASGSSANNQLVFQDREHTSNRSKIDTVPSFSVPGFSSGHPCAYAPASAGIVFLGGGISGGGQKVDNACLLAQMGYNQEAMLMIAGRDKAARDALISTGRVQPKAQTRTRAVAPVRSATSTQAVAYRSCVLEGNSLRVRVKAGANKATAIAQCRAAVR